MQTENHDSKRKNLNVSKVAKRIDNHDKAVTLPVRSQIRSYSQNVNEFVCPVRCCVENCTHSLHSCKRFAEIECKDRWSVAKKKVYCYKYLNTGHMKSECRSKCCCRNCRSIDHHKGPTFLYRRKEKLILTPLQKYINEVPADLVCTEPDSTVLPEIGCNLMSNMIQCETNLCCTVPVYMQPIARKCSKYCDCLTLIVYRYRYILTR